MKEPKTLADFLTYVMDKHGLTYREFADACGFHQSVITHIKAGKYKYPLEILHQMRPHLTKVEWSLLKQIMQAQLVRDLEAGDE